MTPDDWLKFVWLPLAVTIAGTVIAAVVIDRLLPAGKTVRRRFWRPIWNVVRWPFTLRLTTTRRQGELAAQGSKVRRDAARFREVCDLLGVWPVREDSTVVPERVQRLRDAAGEAQRSADKQVAAMEVRLRNEVEATRALARKEIQDQLRINEGQGELARETGRQEGYAEAMLEVAAQREVRLTKPVWRVQKSESAAIELSNVQEDAVVSDVGIFAAMGDFAFDSANQWAGPFTEPVRFLGQRVGTGRSLDVTFKVRYRDANGDYETGEAVLAREPRQPVLPVTAKRRAEDGLGTMQF